MSSSDETAQTRLLRQVTCQRSAGHTGLHAAAAQTALYDFVVWGRPQLGRVIWRWRQGSLAPEAEPCCGARVVPAAKDDGSLEVWSDGHPHAYSPTSELRTAKEARDLAEATCAAMRQRFQELVRLMQTGAVSGAFREWGQQSHPEAIRTAGKEMLDRIETLQTLRTSLEGELATAKIEVARLQALLDRDQTGLAAALARIVAHAKSYRWISEGRGAYVWDDEQYKIEIAALALRASGLRANEAFHPDAVVPSEAVVMDASEVLRMKKLIAEAEERLEKAGDALRGEGA